MIYIEIIFVLLLVLAFVQCKRESKWKKSQDEFWQKWMFENYKGILCTKPENNVRFFDGLMMKNNREHSPYRYRRGAICECLINDDDFRLFHLYPDGCESTVFTDDGITVANLKYHPWFDIDRYAVKCLHGNVEPDGCPVFDRLRKLVAVEKSEDIPPYVYPTFARVEKDPAYGEAGATYVGYGDGNVGPIAAKSCFGRWNPFGCLPALCATCGHCGHPRVNDRKDCDGGCHEKVKVSGKEVSHGGIIAFFKRIFGRD